MEFPVLRFSLVESLVLQAGRVKCGLLCTISGVMGIVRKDRPKTPTLGKDGEEWGFDSLAAMACGRLTMVCRVIPAGRVRIGKGR